MKTAIRTALEYGYRLIDTAYSYKNEKLIGQVLSDVLKSGGLKREDIFITTKVCWKAIVLVLSVLLAC